MAVRFGNPQKISSKSLVIPCYSVMLVCTVAVSPLHRFLNGVVVAVVEPNTLVAAGVTGVATVSMAAVEIFAGVLSRAAIVAVLLFSGGAFVVEDTRASSASVGVLGIMVDPNLQFVIDLALFAGMLVIFLDIDVTLAETSTGVFLLSVQWFLRW